jgi:hypothetical protein
MDFEQREMALLQLRKLWLATRYSHLIESQTIASHDVRSNVASLWSALEINLKGTVGQGSLSEVTAFGHTEAWCWFVLTKDELLCFDLEQYREDIAKREASRRRGSSSTITSPSRSVQSWTPLRSVLPLSLVQWVRCEECFIEISTVTNSRIKLVAPFANEAEVWTEHIVSYAQKQIGRFFFTAKASTRNGNALPGTQICIDTNDRNIQIRSTYREGTSECIIPCDCITSIHASDPRSLLIAWTLDPEVSTSGFVTDHHHEGQHSVLIETTSAYDCDQMHKVINAAVRASVGVGGSNVDEFVDDFGLSDNPLTALLPVSRTLVARKDALGTGQQVSAREHNNSTNANFKTQLP